MSLVFSNIRIDVPILTWIQHVTCLPQVTAQVSEDPSLRKASWWGMDGRQRRTLEQNTTLNQLLCMVSQFPVCIKRKSSINWNQFKKLCKLVYRATAASKRKAVTEVFQRSNWIVIVTKYIKLVLTNPFIQIVVYNITPRSSQECLLQAREPVFIFISLWAAKGWGRQTKKEWP